MTDPFGPLISRGSVQAAVLTLLQTPPAGRTQPLILYYLAAAERAAEFSARTIDPPATYRGGTDFEAYADDSLPAIIVVVTPEGDPERFEAGSYAQWFNVQLGAIVTGDTETEARAVADSYGVALAALVAQNGGLGLGADGTFAAKTVLTGFPGVTFAADDTTNRNILRSTVTFRTMIDPVLVEQRPFSFPAEPYTTPDDAPTINTVKIEFSSEDPAGNESVPTGANVVNGAVIVTE